MFGKCLRCRGHLVTTPATAAVYGTACGGGPALVGRTAPRIGDAAFGFDVVDAPAGAPLLLVGATSPANLPIGPCSLLVTPGQATLFELTGPTGFLSLDMPLPNAPTWLGVQLFLQAAVLQPAAPGGFVMSPGLHVTIGD